MKKNSIVFSLWFMVCSLFAQNLTYPIVGTNQSIFYNQNSVVDKVSTSSIWYQQDAGVRSNTSCYQDHGDGTVTDLVTGLMWEEDMGDKIIYNQAKSKAKSIRKGGYSDWRVPTIKELYSLIQFTGQAHGERVIKPFIDTKYFKQPKGNVHNNEREIDAQTWSSTICNSKVMGRDMETAFGVNFLDGRIKSYPIKKRESENKLYFRMVRGNLEYGKNQFVDNNDGTISDLATGLMWQKADSGNLFDWEEALKYAKNLALANFSDWRVPTAKELQSIVDYTRSPEATNSPAISPLFETTSININGIMDYPYFWSSTTHLDGNNPGDRAVYVSFGRAWGKNPRTGEICNAHGAGAQRSDPKAGNKSEYPQYFGPQGDRLAVYNGVRCVRNIDVNNIKVTPKAVTTPVEKSSSKTANEWRFAVVGDPHVPNADVLKRIVPDLIKNKVELVLFPGDLVHAGKGIRGDELAQELAQFNEIIEPLKAAGIELIAVRGNHEADVKGNSIRPWKRLISEDLNIVKKHRNFTFIGLDNYIEGERTVDLTWLSESLNKAQGTQIIVFGHEPAFTVGTFHQQCLDANLEMRNDFWSLLENAEVKYYFCGHAHQFNYSQITHNGKTIYQVVSGGGGGRLQRERNENKDAPTYQVVRKELKVENGYALVKVNEDQLEINWISK